MKNLSTYRELLWTLTASSISARYKQTLFGIGWAVLQPLALMGIAVLVFQRFAGVQTDGVPYSVFTFAALLPWTMHSATLSQAIPSLAANAGLLRKVYFPREVFVAAAVLSGMIDYLISLAIFLGLLLFYRQPIGLTVLYLPLVLAIQLVLTTGVALGGAIANVAFRDVAKSLPFLLQIWLLASPVVYPMQLVPEQWRTLYSLNPMVGIIEGYRSIWIRQAPPDASLLIAGAVALGIFTCGYWLFKRGEEIIADIV